MVELRKYMAVSVRITRLIGAVALSAALIGGAFIVTSPSLSLSFLHPGIADAESTAAVLAAYAQKDTDGDGLPDWEEALYGTDPHNAHSVSATLTDGQAAAQGLLTPKSAATATASTSAADLEASIPGNLPADGSLTQEFSQDFFKSYSDALSQSSQSSDGSISISDDTQQAVVQQLISTYAQKASTMVISPYSSLDVHTSTSVSLSDYSGDIEQIFSKNVPADTTGPVDLMQAYVVNDDATALPKIQAAEASYHAIATALADVSVPPAAAADHLMLMQSFDTLSRAMQATAQYQQDPAAVLGAVGVYQPAADSMKKGIDDLASQLIAAGEPAGDQPGALLIQIARSLDANSTTAQ